MTWRVDTVAGRKFVLQRINTHIFRKPELLMQNLLRTSTRLDKSLYPLRYPRPQFARDAFITTDATGNCWRLYPWIPGKTLSCSEIGTHQARLAGQAFGSFLNVLSAEDPLNWPPSIEGFHDLDTAAEGLADAVKADPLQRRPQSGELLDIIAKERERTSSLQRRIANQDIPARIVHHDTKIENLLFAEDHDSIVGVVDLDTTMPGLALHDFGDLVRSSAATAAEDSRDPRFSRSLFKALACGYLEAAKPVLSAAETASLAQGPAYITLTLAIRFLSDYLAGDKYFSIAHEEHNLYRAHTQLHLLEHIRVNESWIQDTLEQIHRNLH